MNPSSEVVAASINKSRSRVRSMRQSIVQTIPEEEVIEHARAIVIRSHDIDSTLAQAARSQGQQDMLVHI